MSARTIIGDNPPNDGRNWDAQCARCGSSLAFEPCESCGGDGFDGHDCGEDTCCCAFPHDNVPCHICRGHGSFAECLSRAEWCEAHPMAGREQVKPNTPEWFTYDTECAP